MTGSFWPSPSQRELLEVALGTGEEAQAAWQRLRPTLDLDNLEPGSFALLPLVYQALVENGSDDSLLPRLKGIYKNTWVRNNLTRCDLLRWTARASASSDTGPAAASR